MGPIAGVRIGHVDGEYVVNPTLQQLEESKLNLIMAGTKDAVMMVESGSTMLSEAEMLKALELGHAEIKRLVALQEELVEMVGKPKRQLPPAAEKDAAVAEKAAAVFAEHGATAYAADRQEGGRNEALSAAKADLVETLNEEEKLRAKEYKAAFDGRGQEVRARHDPRARASRIDGRGLDDIRAIDCQVGVLPRTHGSALFTRGETQALVVPTLGTSERRAADRRHRGLLLQAVHAALQLPALLRGRGPLPARRPAAARSATAPWPSGRSRPVLPDHEDFPYTVRLVSEITREQRLLVHGHGVRRQPRARWTPASRSRRRWPASPWA